MTYLNFFIEYHLFCSRLVSDQLLLDILFSQQRSHFDPIVVHLRILMAPKHLSFPPPRVSLSLVIPSWLLNLYTIWGCMLLKAIVQKKNPSQTTPNERNLYEIKAERTVESWIRQPLINSLCLRKILHRLFTLH
jgi:hypothetical protein